MLIVMTVGATRQQVEGVVDAIERLGLCSYFYSGQHSIKLWAQVVRKTSEGFGLKLL